MRTTTNEVGRRGGAHSHEDAEDILENARTILADISAFLKSRRERLKGALADTEDEAEMKDLEDKLMQTQKSWRLVLDLQAKAGRACAHAPAMDLEQARAEILGRLARLAS